MSNDTDDHKNARTVNPNSVAEIHSRQLDKRIEEVHNWMRERGAFKGKRRRNKSMVRIEKDLAAEPKSDPPDHIRFKLKWIADHSDSLNARQLDLVASFEDAFKISGTLSPRQCKVLHNIYMKTE